MGARDVGRICRASCRCAPLDRARVESRDAAAAADTAADIDTETNTDTDTDRDTDLNTNINTDPRGQVVNRSAVHVMA